MAVQTPKVGPDYGRLNTTLATSKTQSSNNALYQTISGLITGVKSYQDWINSQFAIQNTAFGTFTNAIGLLNGSINQLFILLEEINERNSVKFGVSVINEGTPDTIASDVLGVVTYDTAIFDEGSMFDSPSKLVATATAQYLVTGRISFDGNSDGFRKIYLTTNGSANILGEFKYQPAGVSMVVPICQLIELAEDDYIELYIDQNSADDVIVVGALEMVRISYS